MATWVTHLMVADLLLKDCPSLDRRGFCVGSIAPDCNVENEDWTAFTPSREITHWMSGSRKAASDCERFYGEYLLPRLGASVASEEYAFLLGYYAHLIEDAEFQRFIRDEARVRAVWSRIHSIPDLHARSLGLSETWDSVKKLIPKEARMREIDRIEAEYLLRNPSSGYLTEILPLRSFPDYIDYLPPGSIVRKIGVMGSLPSSPPDHTPLISVSQDEYSAYVLNALRIVRDTFADKGLIP